MTNTQQTPGSLMRAVRFESFGGPSVLTVADVPVPEPEAGQITVDVTHAGVNFAEVMFRRGQFPVGLPHHPGLEAVGTVRAVGDGVTGFRAGERVAALTLGGGGNAEVVAVGAEHAVRLDGPLAGLDGALAAGALCNVTTALGVLTSAGHLAEGESVVVLAAAGGVGTAAAQLARTLGAGTVIGVTSSPAKAEYARGFGYDSVVSYEDLEREVAERTGGAGADLVLDSVGGAFRSSVTGLLAAFGRHVIFGNAAAEDVTFEGNHPWYTNSSLVGYNLGGVAGRAPGLLRSHLERALAEVAAKTVRVDVRVLPLKDVAHAHELLETRASTGKYVLDVRA
ncbi:MULTISPECIES: quinone oxidoreductase family protein [Streptomyces]|uniref:Zinc-binding dehydrogenase n=1 Tax=Streptomyces argyrophylli TaxID=2726118 RepID=A0A6M4PKD1_9ACTN|nr:MULTISPECIES: zinc-binding dehydrogenase [Streptomyces]QJS11007.1 zinc-binding dehydrogenase [Streptomyces argyrophyllae]